MRLCIIAIFLKATVHTFNVTTGCPIKSEKSNHLIWYKNKVEFFFLAHQLRGNIRPFCLITLTKPLCLLFWSKTSMQKILRFAKKFHFRPILANWLFNTSETPKRYQLWHFNGTVIVWGLWGVKKALCSSFDIVNSLK